jgi:hypothetical protein
VQFDETLQDGVENVDDVVQLEDPNEADLSASPEDIVIGNFSRPAGVVQFFIGGKLHQVVIERDQQFLADELLQFVWPGFDFVVFELTGFGEHLDFLIENDVADIIFRDFRDFDEQCHNFDLLGVAAFLFELLDDHLQKVLFLRLCAFLFEHFHASSDHLYSQTVGD